MNTNQNLEAAKSLAVQERSAVSKAAKYVHQFHPLAFEHVFRQVGGDREEGQQWYNEQRKLKKLEWDLLPQMQDRIAARQQRARIIMALSG